MGGVMSPDKLERARLEIEAARLKGSLKAVQLQRIAKKLDLKPLSGGSEPNWGDAAKGSRIRPVSIPDHGKGKDLKHKTGQSILDGLENALAIRLEERERGAHNEGKREHPKR
jgi:hypothetical protein